MSPTILKASMTEIPEAINKPIVLANFANIMSSFNFPQTGILKVTCSVIIPPNSVLAHFLKDDINKATKPNSKYQ